VWRQAGPSARGRFVRYDVPDGSPDMSFLELLDVLNQQLIARKEEPIAFDHDCREGICGACGMVINGRPHGPQRATTACQLHLRHFADGAEIASGARHSSASTHILMLDEGSGVVTEGLEGNGTEVRAVVGGYGRYSGATGQVILEVLGSNGTAGFNLRFTFTLKVASGQEPTELMRRGAPSRRH